MSTSHEQQPTDGHIAVGRILTPWGLQGDLKIVSLTDFPERFAPDSQLYAGERTLTVERSRVQGDRVVVKFVGVNTRTQAETLKGILLEIPEDAVTPLPPGEYYRFQLVGLGAWSSDGEQLGTIVEVLTTGSNDVFVIQGNDREILVPDLKDIIQEIDIENSRMVIQLVPGLVD